MELYVRATSNYPPGWPLQHFDELSETWTGDDLELPFGEGERRTLTVVGWSDQFGGRPRPVHVVRVRHVPATGRPVEGWLVYGGNAGVRILDVDAEPIPGVDDHLPRGYGRPFVWVEDPNDLPAKVRAVVG